MDIDQIWFGVADTHTQIFYKGQRKYIFAFINEFIGILLFYAFQLTYIYEKNVSMVDSTC